MKKASGRKAVKAVGGKAAAVRRQPADALARAPSSIRLEPLFSRIVTILEDARARVVRAVNSEMVLAYWHIGRELVEHLQAGDDRAEYGRKLIDELSARLTGRLGRGFSTTNIRYFRAFYLAYAERSPAIRHIGSGEFALPPKPSGERHTRRRIRNSPGGELESAVIAVALDTVPQGFSPVLGWSHYRQLMNVEHDGARRFYEIEAEQQGWSVEHLERQIHTQLFARLLRGHSREASALPA